MGAPGIPVFIMIIYRLKIFLLRILGYEKPLRVALLKYLSLKFKQFRPHYETILLESCIEAKKLGYEEVSVLELGVAGGNGIIALEKYKKKIEKYLKLKINIYGFDSGEGLPRPNNIHDLPFAWKKGDYKIDKKKLESKIRKSKIFYGDIKNTVDDFLQINPKNIISIFFDMDFYTSTKDFLNQTFKLEKCFCPRVYCYFDEVFSANHWLNEYLGERLAIKEFNEENEKFKIGLALDNVTDFKFPLGKGALYILNNFNHKDYRNYIGIDNEKSLATDDYKVTTKIF